MKKKEKILIAVTVILVIFLAACFFYDRSSFLMERTLPYTLPGDARLVDIDKHGFLFYRVAYEAKLEIDPEIPEEILVYFSEGYDGQIGRQLSNEQYETMTNYMYENYYSYVKIKPHPASGSYVWMQEADLEDGHHVIHFMDIEEGNRGYLYIYYTR